MLNRKISASGPKKLLAIDGGGIRGVVALQVLARLEAVLREKSGQADFRISDYFDFISGTSTGAIIAAGLSIGLSVSEINELYTVRGHEIFKKAPAYRQWYYRYRSDALEAILKEVFGAETTLGSEKLLTLLMMVLRNADTDSPWPLSNNPRAKFNIRGSDGDHTNLDLKLWQLVRASAAAPLFFPPAEIQVGSRRFLFVDGAVTPYNNPAFLTYLMATLPPYRLEWPTGADRMLLVSIGTGTVPTNLPSRPAPRIGLLTNVATIPGALITAGVLHQDLSCRALGRCLAGQPIDGELGDLVGHRPSDPHFTYVRYDVELSDQGLRSIGCDVDPQRVRRIDLVDAVPELLQVGHAVAASQLRAEHFAGFPPSLPDAVAGGVSSMPVS